MSMKIRAKYSRYYFSLVYLKDEEAFKVPRYHKIYLASKINLIVCI